MMRPGRIRQGELFDPDRPKRVLEDGRRQELLLLLATLLREAATREGGEHEPDHG